MGCIGMDMGLDVDTDMDVHLLDMQWLGASMHPFSREKPINEQLCFAYTKSRVSNL